MARHDAGERDENGEGEEPPAVQPATAGTGPLLERDYQAVIEGADVTPVALMELVLADFPRFSPEDMACFTRPNGATGPLAVDEEMGIDIKASGHCTVRVVRIDPHSFTLRTLDGHPEAGRITFGAYQDLAGDLIFRIRSRARVSSGLRYVGYLLFGKGMQTRVWVSFIQRVAEACGGTIRGEVHTETKEVQDTLADEGGLDTPTFVAH